MGVAVGIDQPQALTGVVHGVLKLTLRGIVAVVTGGVHHTQLRSEAASPTTIQAEKGGTGIAQHPV